MQCINVFGISMKQAKPWKYKIYKKYVLKKDPILLEVTKINFLKPKVHQSTSAETSVQDNPIENYLTELQSK